ncbi:hypothetical protein LEN26_002051 [Aphanomyces euteiches]|nr:hypothetical protein AeMF1_004493 [Aphanomyces euteiches]KAH9160027.1 hypothetical protein LEN26_002051 [Aphanomyces euteiches]KAH9190064.1 hypothetical protein AeNC1_007955 [Aphanomyces euteiches]
MARAAWNITSSMVTRAMSPNKAKFAGVGINKPHVWKTQVGFLDVDLNAHLNNAAYLYNMELARWHLSGYVSLELESDLTIPVCVYRLSGLMGVMLSKKWGFLVGSQSIRYRHAVAPFKNYEIHSEIVHYDDTWFFFCHRFVCPKTGKLYAEGLTRSMVKDSNRKTISFEEVCDEMGLAPPQIKQTPDIVTAFLEWDSATKTSVAEWKPEEHIDHATPAWLRSVNLPKHDSA